MKHVFIAVCFLFLLPLVAGAQFTEDTVSVTSTPEEKIINEIVDIIIEADTMVSPFYRGRREPSAGSTIRAIAVLNNTAETDSYSYRWEVENTVIGGGAIAGQDVILFTAPQAGQFRIRVDVTDQSGNNFATAQRYITVSEPVVAFYQDNPLRGVSETAIQDDYALIGDEVSVRAEPYFVNQNVFSGQYDLSWHIDGTEVSSPTTNPQVITLRNNGGSGTFMIDFALRNLSSLTQYARNSFTISF